MKRKGTDRENAGDEPVSNYRLSKGSRMSAGPRPLRSGGGATALFSLKIVRTTPSSQSRHEPSKRINSSPSLLGDHSRYAPIVLWVSRPRLGQHLFAGVPQKSRPQRRTTSSFLLRQIFGFGGSTTPPSLRRYQRVTEGSIRWALAVVVADAPRLSFRWMNQVC